MKVLVVVARRYNGHELWTALGVMQERGHTFEVISTSTLIMDEVTFQRNTIERTLDDVPNLDGFDALMFVSGNMADTEAYWDDPRTLAYVKEAHERGIPLAAICCSVPTIASAAEGKKVSFFPLIRSEQRLKRAGAICQKVSISADGNLVTAEHQMSSQVWAETFCNVMEGLPPGLELEETDFMPLGRERKPIPEVERFKDIAERTGKTGLDG
jgi:putative intracellular protease/amidase